MSKQETEQRIMELELKRDKLIQLADDVTADIEKLKQAKRYHEKITESDFININE
jgi:hypothetical protein